MKVLRQMSVCLCLVGFAPAGASPEREAWLNERRNLINDAENAPDVAKIPRLSRTIRGIGRRLENASPESLEIYHGAVQAMLTIPGYAEYYRDQVLAAREQLDDVRAGKNTEMLEGTAVHRLRDAQADCFGTLGFLPSVETVRVLGAFLSDDQGWRILTSDSTHMDNEWASLEIPNCRYAANALERLPIVESPFERSRWRRKYTREEIAVWQQWYQEIKDGKRTFRFEGDPTEYDLDGPAPKQKLERIARADRRDTERAHGRERAETTADEAGQEKAETPGGLPAAVSIAAAALLFVSVAWYFARMGSR